MVCVFNPTNRTDMYKSLMLLGIATFICSTVVSEPLIKEKYDHRIGINPFGATYEHLKEDSIYTGVDFQYLPIFDLSKHRTKRTGSHINLETRAGYNFALSNIDTLTLYAGVGHSRFQRPGSLFFLKNWTYASIGLKYLHEFGSIFKAGINVKASSGLQETHRFFGENVVLTDSKLMPTIGLPCVWTMGEKRNWEIQLEPYYFQTPQDGRSHYLGSKVHFGYRF
jgi:hypothetical protein